MLPVALPSGLLRYYTQDGACFFRARRGIAHKLLIYGILLAAVTLGFMHEHGRCCRIIKGMIA